MIRLLWLFSVFLLSSCGYQWGEGDLMREYATISVPFVKGDLQGALTRSVINEIATQTSLAYVNSGADLELIMTLKQIDEQNIGFRYDQNKHRERVDYIIPDETRLLAFVEVTLIDRSQGTPIIGPVLLADTYDFDHDYYSSQGRINERSLGQLTNYDEAYDAALIPLYQNLARKVVDYLKNAW